MKPSYLELLQDGTLAEKARQLNACLSKCNLCPRLCGVNRLKGESGFCKLADVLVMNTALPHHGEEPPIAGTRGAGTVFLSGCSLQCVFCQNYQISKDGMGRKIRIDELAGSMLKLQAEGCHNIEFVTPSPHLPFLVQALLSAAEAGLRLPVVYNCGGYENPEIIRVLKGVVDIYLPDCKYGNEEDAYAFSGVRNYVRNAVKAIREMVRQVGPCLEEDGEVAERGIIVRHLVLPNRCENSLDVLKLLSEAIPLSVPLSIMGQYTPVPAVYAHPDLGRRLTRSEYETVVNAALDCGFEHIFVQEIDEQHAVPDFRSAAPFLWEKGKPV